MEDLLKNLFTTKLPLRANAHVEDSLNCRTGCFVDGLLNIYPSNRRFQVREGAGVSSSQLWWAIIGQGARFVPLLVKVRLFLTVSKLMEQMKYKL